MKIYIITEGFKSTGYGHVTRCLSIYQAFEENGYNPVMIINGDNNAKEILQQQTTIFFDWFNKREKLFKEIKDADIVIIDSYIADISVYGGVSKIVKTPVYIDDTIRLDYPEGIILNGCIGAENFKYPRSNNKTYLLGIKYQSLRKSFWNIQKRDVKKQVSDILITFGGTDLRNLTPKVLQFLTQEFPLLNKHIVIGNGFDNVVEIENLKDAKTFLYYNPNDKEMKFLMLKSDIAISAAGQTLYELAATSTLTIAIGIAENQTNNINGWLKNNFIEFAGWWNDNDLITSIKIKLNGLLDLNNYDVLITNKLNTFVTGGAINTVKEILLQYQNRNVKSRRANSNDAKNVFQLSNAPDVRANSIHEDKIEWNTHVTWFSKKINNPNCCYYVAYENKIFVGQVRYDIENNEATVSISIDKAYRKRGLAVKLLKNTVYNVFCENKDVNVITAFIKPINVSSLNVFENAGFYYKNKIQIANQIYSVFYIEKSNAITLT